MAEESQANQENAQPPKRRKLLSLILLLLMGGTCGAAGFAVPLLVPVVFNAENQPAAESGDRSSAKPAFVPFGDSVVNLNSERFNRYLRVSITLQVNEGDVASVTKELEKHKAVLKSWLLSYLSDKSMEEIRGSAGQNRLRREIHHHFNSVLFPDGYDRIRDVLFEEFNVQ